MPRNFLYTENMKKSLKRLLALIGAILLALLAVVTLLVAIFLPGSQILVGCAVAIIGIPILLWLALFFLRDKNLPNPSNENKDEKNEKNS
jgi:ABC-type Fe3+-siderophore transport system permease subunit